VLRASLWVTRLMRSRPNRLTVGFNSACRTTL
jgi:hypothetical protein